MIRHAQIEGINLTSTQPTNDPLDSVPSDRLWLRSELMGTQVITRDTGRRLGVVGEVVVDIDRREVIALGLRDNPLTRFLPGLPRWMPLERIRQVGDVILVDSADSLSEGFTPERYSRVINCQVITESGQELGRVLGFAFDIETGELTTLVMGALGVPLLGEGVLSTWEIPVDEIVSSGTDRIIVYEGAEEKLKQLNSGFLEKLGVGGSSWEERENERYRVDFVPVENQLSAGESIEEESRMIQASREDLLESNEELEYVELDNTDRQSYTRRRYLDENFIDEVDQSPNYTNPIINNDHERNSAEEVKFSPGSRKPTRQSLRISEEPLDVEPVDTQYSQPENGDSASFKSRSEVNELDDPW